MSTAVTAGGRTAAPVTAAVTAADTTQHHSHTATAQHNNTRLHTCPTPTTHHTTALTRSHRTSLPREAGRTETAPSDQHTLIAPAPGSAVHRALRAEARSAVLRDGMPGLNDTGMCAWSVLWRSALASQRASRSAGSGRPTGVSRLEAASASGNASCFFLHVGHDCGT